MPKHFDLAFLMLCCKIFVTLVEQVAVLMISMCMLVSAFRIILFLC